MADDFEKAVLITFNYGGSIDPALKERAAAYVAGIKQSSDCWKLCVERFGASMYPEVKFWCLQTLQEVINACYEQLDVGAQQAIKGSLLTWLQRDCTVEQQALPPFLRNKLAQAIVGVVKAEYPAVWPNFFRELCAAAATGPGLADMFGRIMVSVDEDIISLEIPRSAEETKLSMHVKDSMRESCISEVAGTWYSLTQLYKSSRPELAAFVLSSCARYVHWMDIGLVANDKFIPLLGELLDCPHTGLRCAATDVLIEIVSKRMEPTAKIGLVQQLKVVEACERLSTNLVMAAGASKAAAAAAGSRAGQGGGGDGSSGSDGSAVAAAAAAAGQQLAQDEELLAKYAKLLATLAGEVMDALKRIENVVISFTTLGLGVNDDAGREAGMAAASANQLLESLTRAALNAFSSGIETISMPLLSFINSYVARLRALVKRGEQLPASAQLHLQAIFGGVAAAARYPNNGANEDEDYPELSSSNGTSSSSLAANSGLASSNGSSAARMSDAGYQAAREEQFDVEEQRKELLTLFKNTAKLAFPEALQFAAAKLQGVLASAGSSTAAAAAPSGLANGLGSAAGGSKSGAAGSSSSGQGKFQETELAVTLVYELGEGAPEEALKPGSGGLAQLVMLLLDQAAALPAGQHRLVALAVLETCVRYCKLLQNNQGSIPGVLGLFLGARGLGHPSPTVATRAAYLLSRLVKTLRGNLRQYAGDILQQLQPYLEVVATRPPPSNAAAVGTSREAAAGRAPVTAAVVDDRLYVFESVGLLLGQEELQADQQLAALQQLLQPLTRQIEANLGPAAAEAAGGSSSGSSSWAILQSLEAIARLNKGFKWELCTRSRPQIGAAFIACLEVSLAVPQTLPGNKQLRGRFIAFLHRMVESLMSAVLPYLPPALEALMGSQHAAPGADVADMSDVLALMVQLVQRFKEALVKLVEAALPVAVVKVHTLLGADWDWSGRSALPAAAVAAVAAQSSPQQQQQQQQQPQVTVEELREKGDLQRSYYSLLLGLTMNNLTGSLLQLPAQVLDNIMTALAKGAATHVDPAVRRSCIQVFERLLSDWCPAGSNELVPGFRAYAVQQLGGQACVLGLFGNLAATSAAANGPSAAAAASQAGPLDARDAATMQLLTEVGTALKLLHERCGDELSVHLCNQVLPGSGLPGELQQQLVRHVRESDARQVKEFLRELLLSARGGQQGK